jgi:hypothetical protein
MTTTYIEVYVWENGAPRPGAKTKASRSCLDILVIPSHGQIPQKGDVILLNTENPEAAPAPYRVISRELLWFRSPNENPQTPASWSKMWIYVRRMSDEEYAQED